LAEKVDLLRVILAGVNCKHLIPFFMACMAYGYLKGYMFLFKKLEEEFEEAVGTFCVSY